MNRAAIFGSLALVGGGLWIYARRAAARGETNFLTDAVAILTGDANVRAFLAMIRAAEGTDGPNGYYTLFGGNYFLETDTHPAERTYGEWLIAGRRDFTTAAGAYQITQTTWQRLCAQLGVDDFGPATQDAMAVELVREAGALALVRAGRFDEAVKLCSGIWASLPYATVPQPRRSLDYVKTAYVNAGGEIVTAAA